MNQAQPDPTLYTNPESIIPGLQRYKHPAMATTYEIFLVHPDLQYAQGAVRAAFDELDRIELDLSRYIENSDISRFNAVKANQPLLMGISAFECLLLAQKVYGQTDGAFDVTIGSLFRCWLDRDNKLRQPTAHELKQARQLTGMNLIKLDAEELTALSEVEGLQVDLGGIGKGYAVDRMANTLREWGIDAALLHGGASSVLGMGEPPDQEGWPVTISDPENLQDTLVRLNLKDQALGASGLLRGRHIIDPRTAEPVQAHIAAWVHISLDENPAGDIKNNHSNMDNNEPIISLPDSVGPHPITTFADGLSTSFMVMSPPEIKDYCRRHKNIRALIVQSQEKVSDSQSRFFLCGDWPKTELTEKLIR